MDYVTERMRRLADIPLRTEADVVVSLTRAKRNKADVALARLMLRHGRLTDEARAWVAKEYTQQIAEKYPTALFIEVGSTRYQVDSYKQASELFCAARDKAGEGASNTPSPKIVDENGNVIAYISYNGRVWAGAVYVAGAKPLYEVCQ